MSAIGSVDSGPSMIDITLPPRPSARKCSGERERSDLRGAAIEQRVGSGIECVSSRQHIIDQPDVCSRSQPACDAKRAANVLAPVPTDEFRLVSCLMDSHQGIGGPRPPEVARNSAGDGIDVVESPPAFAARVKGNADDAIGPCARLFENTPRQFIGEMIDRETDRDRRSEGAAGGLEPGYPASNGAFIAKQRAATMERAAFCQASRATLEDAFVVIA